MTTNYDMYQFALAYKPQFHCEQNPNPNPNPNPKVSRDSSSSSELLLIPHGLWPSNSNKNEKKALHYCSTESEESKKELMKHLNRRQRHQWLKHGSCSNLSMDEYFVQEKQLYRSKQVKSIEKKLNEALSNKSIIDMNALNQKNIAVQTTEDCILKEIFMCYTKNNDTNNVDKPITCPSYIKKRSYRHNCKNVYLQQKYKCQTLSKDMVKLLKKNQD